MQWEAWVGGAQSSYEMVFECSNSSFCCIAAMDAGRGGLELDIFSCKEAFEDVNMVVLPLNHQLRN